MARRYGFGGGLVPGVTVYAYLTHPLVEAFGTDWLERGTASVKFVKPVLEGDEVRVWGRVTARSPFGLTLAVTASTAAGDCAVATATLPATMPALVDPSGYGVAPLPAERPRATRERLASLAVLGTPIERYDEAVAVEYLDKISEGLPLYRGDGAFVHPACFLHQANKALSQNVRLGPWIHVGSV